MKSLMIRAKQWFLVFGSGLAVGLILGGLGAKYSIVKDCQTMGMFRVGDAPMSCTYHLVAIPTLQPEPVKEKKK